LTSGRFFFEIDLTSGLENNNSMDGMSVMTGGNFNLEITKDASVADQYIDVFVEYWSEAILNMNTGASWQILN
jgi:hypothetical protein